MSSGAKEMKGAGLRGQPSHHPALSTRGDPRFTPQGGEPIAFPQVSVTVGVGWLVLEVATTGPQLTAWGMRSPTFYTPRARAGAPPLLMLSLRRLQRGNEMPVTSAVFAKRTLRPVF